MSPSHVPLAVLDRTDQPQHMKALSAANTVRAERAALHRQVADGNLALAEIVLTVPPCCRTLMIEDALCWQHRWGVHRARRFLNGLSHMHPGMRVMGHRSLDSLTDREARAIAAGLRGREA